MSEKVVRFGNLLFCIIVNYASPLRSAITIPTTMATAPSIATQVMRSSSTITAVMMVTKGIA